MGDESNNFRVVSDLDTVRNLAWRRMDLHAAGVFAGDFIEAHRAGIRFARRIYSTPKPQELLDIAILNAFPKDTDIIQTINAFNIFRPGYEDIVKPDGSLVIIGACHQKHHFKTIRILELNSSI